MGGWQVVKQVTPQPQPQAPSSSDWQVSTEQPADQWQPVSTAPVSSSAAAIAKVKEFLTKPLFNPLEWNPVTEPINALEKYVASKLPGTSGQVAQGIIGGENELAKGLTSPLSMALLGAGIGLETMPVMSRLASAGFSLQSLIGAYKGIPAVKQAIDNGDVESAAQLITGEAGNLAMAGAAGLHAVGGNPPIATEPSAPRVEESGLPAGMIDQLTKPVDIEHQLMSINADNERLRESLRNNEGDEEQRAAAQVRLAQNLEMMRELEQHKFTQAIGSSMSAQHIGEINDLINKGVIPPEPSKDELRESLSLSSGASRNEPSEADVHAIQSGGAGREPANAEGGEITLPPTSPSAGEENLRVDNGITRGEGGAGVGPGERANAEAAGRIGPYDRVVASLINPTLKYGIKENHPVNYDAGLDRPFGAFNIELRDNTGYLVGDALVGMNGDGTANINDTFIDSRYKNQGLGKEIYRLAIDEAQRYGVDTVKSGVAGTSDEAARVWRSLAKSHNVEEIPDSSGGFKYKLTLNKPVGSPATKLVLDVLGPVANLHQ